MARVFLYVPVYYIVRVLPSCPHSATAGALDGSIPSVCRPYQKDNQKQAKYSRCSARAFSLSLIFARRRRTAKPPDALPCGRCPAGVCVALSRCESYSCGACAWVLRQRRCHARLRLSSPLVSAVSLQLRPKSRPLATWSTALLQLLQFVPLSCSSSDSTKASAWLLSFRIACASSRYLSCLTVFRRASLPN